MMIRVCLGEGSYANVVSVVSEEFFSISSLNATRMRNASNMHSLLEALEGSRYYKVITSMYSREKEPTLFEFETTLDIYYFTQAKNNTRSSVGKTKEDVEHCIGTEADLMNLLWIFRAKQYYNMSRELIYSFLIPVHYKLSDKQLIEIVESDDVNAVYEAAAKTKYAQVFEDESHKNHEKAVFRLLMRMFQKNGLYDLSAILTYSYAKELEIENISSVIEGVRYQVIPEKIMEYVVIRRCDDLAIEKMKFINLYAPLHRFDEVCDKYIADSNIHLEDALSIVKGIDDLYGFGDMNPYMQTYRKILDVCEFLSISLEYREDFTAIEMEEAEAYLADVLQRYKDTKELVSNTKK